MTSPAPAPAKIRLLVVDDDPSVRAMLVEYLSGHRYDVRAADGGAAMRAEIERDLADFARSSNGGMIVTASALSGVRRELIAALAARHRLPAVHVERAHVTVGGLMSYGADFADQYRRAAGYIDRILKGEKPADLPVQAPTKYQLILNLKAAKAIGLTIPPTMLARADETIE